MLSSTMLNNTYQVVLWQTGTGPTHNLCSQRIYAHLHIKSLLFILRVRLLCSVNRALNMELKNNDCTVLQQEGSSNPGPTTGCFLLNKDFLLSAEVPTDAFIGAKFTLCTRRELPFCCCRWAFSCLSCSWAYHNKVGQPQQGSFYMPTSQRICIWILNEWPCALK